MVDLLVVGLDLVTGREVHAGDGRTEEWRKKGHNGDRTLVCLACYEGADLPGALRTVALVLKGREGGARQQHFAHPPGMVPSGGRHSPESLWHAEGKQATRGWAEAQGFTARVEARTADGRRRSDVEVILPGAHRLAIELQRGELSDAAWIARHEDYARAGITHLWLYHLDTSVPGLCSGIASQDGVSTWARGRSGWSTPSPTLLTPGNLRIRHNAVPRTGRRVRPTRSPPSGCRCHQHA
jgi:hypothetical protein